MIRRKVIRKMIKLKRHQILCSITMKKNKNNIQHRNLMIWMKMDLAHLTKRMPQVMITKKSKNMISPCMEQDPLIIS